MVSIIANISDPEIEIYKNITDTQRRHRLELINDADTRSDKLRIQQLTPDEVEKEYENHIFPEWIEIPDRIDPDTGEYIYD